MANLTTKDLLDEILTRIPDNSATMREKCLVWLNEAMRLIVDSPRVWEFLRDVDTSALPYADDNTETVFPPECGRLLKRAVLSVAYEVDKDPSAAASLTLDELELSALKRLDNRRKVIPAREPHGYLTTAAPVVETTIPTSSGIDGGTF